MVIRAWLSFSVTPSHCHSTGVDSVEPWQRFEGSCPSSPWLSQEPKPDGAWKTVSQKQLVLETILSCSCMSLAYILAWLDWSSPSSARRQPGLCKLLFTAVEKTQTPAYVPRSSCLCIFRSSLALTKHSWLLYSLLRSILEELLGFSGFRDLPHMNMLTITIPTKASETHTTWLKVELSSQCSNAMLWVTRAGNWASQNCLLASPSSQQWSRGRGKEEQKQDKSCLISKGEVEEERKKTNWTKPKQSLTASHKCTDAQPWATKKMAHLPKHPPVHFVAEHDIIWHGISFCLVCDICLFVSPPHPQSIPWWGWTWRVRNWGLAAVQTLFICS